jgi:hypothetical protein
VSFARAGQKHSFKIPAEILHDFVPAGVVTETADKTTVEKIKQTKQRKTDK